MASAVTEKELKEEVKALHRMKEFHEPPSNAQQTKSDPSSFSPDEVYWMHNVPSPEINQARWAVTHVSAKMPGDRNGTWVRYVSGPLPNSVGYGMFISGKDTIWEEAECQF